MKRLLLAGSALAVAVPSVALVVDHQAHPKTVVLAADPLPALPDAARADEQPHATTVQVPPTTAAAAPTTVAATTVPPATKASAPAPTAAKPATPAPKPVATTAAPKPVARATTAAAPAAPAYTPPQYGVTTATLALHDSSRNRDLPTSLYLPAAAGTFPLVVFAHGWNVNPQTYDLLLRAWASAGYVVAAPTFPNTSSGHATNENDMVNEPADISYVITQVEQQKAAVLDTSHGVGVAGHSDGAMVALAVGYANKYRDSRVSSVGVYEGSAYSQMFGSYSRGTAALLVAQSDSDEYNSESDGQSAYAVDAGGTRAFLQLYGAKHLPPYTTSNSWSGPVQRATTAWFDVTLAHRTSDMGYVDRAGTVSGISSVKHG